MKLVVIFKFVIWSLLLTLPAHAIAATSMVHCARLQQLAAQQLPMPALLNTAEEDAAMPDCHGAGAQKVDAPNDDAAKKIDAPNDDVKVKKGDGKCSACAACCHATAAVDANIATQFASPTQLPQFVSMLTAFTFITAGLERPPKHPNI